MKRLLLPLFFLGLLFYGNRVHAQCTFISPTVELNFVQTDLNGNCVVNFNLGFEIDINNGNKIIFVHLWKTADYTDFPYATQNQPEEANVLANAVATVIIDNDVVISNPSAPPSQVFKTTYGPDPGIDDNTGPAQHQVLDASDGLTYNRVVVNASENVYRYTINNLQITLPGACASQISFTGDAWSSNGNSAASSVQCTMEGFSFIPNDPLISSSMQCGFGGAPNKYQVQISTSSTQNLQFYYDVFGDNGDDFFDQSLDSLLVNNAGPFTITSGAPYNSGLLNVPAPFGTIDPYRQRTLWIRTEQMKLINPVTGVITNISNLLLDQTANPGCVPLPIKLASFNAAAHSCTVQLNWQTLSEQDSRSFVIQRGTNGTDWKDIGIVQAAGNSTEARKYSFTDIATPAAGRYLYRLRLSDASGEDEYSSIAVVNTNCDRQDISAFPNPVTDRMYVRLPEGVAKELRVYDQTGREVMQVMNVNEGSTELSTASWTPGVYYLMVFGDGQKLGAQRIVKY